jgi:hypothetical protein
MQIMSISKKIFGVFAAVSVCAALVASPAGAAQLIVGPGGGLRVDTANGAPDAAVGDFATVALTGAPQLSSAGITPFTVIDDRGSWVGWHITLTVGDFSDAVVAPNTHHIPANTVTMDAPVVAGADGSDASGFATAGAIDFTAGVKVVSAPADHTSAGTFTVSPLPLRVTVPLDTFAGTYTDTATVALATLP